MVRNAIRLHQAAASRPFAVLLATLMTSCNGLIGTPGGTEAEASGASGGAGATVGSGSGSGSGSGATGGAGSAGGPSLPSSVASPSVARRLSRSELDRTVRDLLGDGTNPASKFLPEDEYTPFDNDYARQHASGALIDSLEAMADDVVGRVLSSGNRARVISCQPSGPGDAACFRQVVETTGRRLFRRPLSDDEIAAYLALQAFATEPAPGVKHDFDTAVGLVLRSMLQDPEFLYRLEVGEPTVEPGVQRLNGYQIATRLSYLLWGSSPDDELLQSAKTDGLADAGQRRVAATRLLSDVRARDQIHRFHAMWLGYRAIPHTPELIAAFDLETTKLIDRVVFDRPTSYLTLFSSNETYLTNSLADHYGLPRPAGGEGWVAYGAGQRAGILSHGSVLASFSKFSDTSPTQRGILVQTRLLCNGVRPPPANVNVDQPPPATASVCKVERYAAHRASASCGTCHNALDPIGLGLENYDIGGRYRSHDDGHEECQIPGQGELPGYGTFAGPGELGRKLLDSGKLEACFVEHVMRYAVGRELRDEERGVVESLSSSFKSSAYSLSELLLGYVESDRFALRQEDSAP